MKVVLKGVSRLARTEDVIYSLTLSLLFAVAGLVAVWKTSRLVASGYMAPLEMWAVIAVVVLLVLAPLAVLIGLLWSYPGSLDRPRRTRR